MLLRQLIDMSGHIYFTLCWSEAREDPNVAHVYTLCSNW